jgi:hypothetical protein
VFQSTTTCDSLTFSSFAPCAMIPVSTTLDGAPFAFASWSPLPPAHAALTTERPATALLGPVFHRLDCASNTGAFARDSARAACKIREPHTAQNSCAHPPISVMQRARIITASVVEEPRPAAAWIVEARGLLPRRLLHNQASATPSNVHSRFASAPYGGREQRKMAPHGSERGHLPVRKGMMVHQESYGILRWVVARATPAENLHGDEPAGGNLFQPGSAAAPH